MAVVLFMVCFFAAIGYHAALRLPEAAADSGHCRMKMRMPLN
jgi:hypothetical protein